MGDLRAKTLNGLFWSFFDSFGTQLISFVIGVVLARLLEPAVFGLLGMIYVFIGISSVFVSSGFGTALIQKQDLSHSDCNTTFIFNIVVAVFFYLLLFFVAPFIGAFYDQLILVKIIRIIGLTIIINAFSIVQQSLLTKRIDFKTQTKISIISVVLSGSVGLTMAYNSYGVWSLVAQQLMSSVMRSILLWVYNSWRPQFEFSLDSFKTLFGFGSKLLASSLLDTIYQNLYYIIIGKFFSPAQLGYYTRAQGYSNLFSRNITTIIQKVSFPVLSTIQNNQDVLKGAFRKIIKTSMLISFVGMMGLAACSESLVIILVGEKWRACIPYLQLLCFSRMLYPLHAINLNVLNVKGRSDLFLKLEIIKKLIAIPVIVIAIYYGIEAMLIGLIFTGWVSYFLNSYYTSGLINYSPLNQLKDIAPSFMVGVTTCIAMWSVELLHMSVVSQFLIQLSVGGTLLFTLLEIFKIHEYVEIKTIIFTYIRKIGVK